MQGIAIHPSRGRIPFYGPEVAGGSAAIIAALIMIPLRKKLHIATYRIGSGVALDECDNKETEFNEFMVVHSDWSIKETFTDYCAETLNSQEINETTMISREFHKDKCVFQRTHKDDVFGKDDTL